MICLVHCAEIKSGVGIADALRGKSRARVGISFWRQFVDVCYMPHLKRDQVHVPALLSLTEVARGVTRVCYTRFLTPMGNIIEPNLPFYVGLPEWSLGMLLLGAILVLYWCWRNTAEAPLWTRLTLLTSLWGFGYPWCDVRRVECST